MKDHEKWDKRFLRLAREISTWSKDPSTKVGCVLASRDRTILGTGYNGFPSEIEDDHRLTNREVKYQLVCHAEENAIIRAARKGISLDGCTLYVTFCPCVRCSVSIIQAGIRHVVFIDKPIPDRWKADMKTSFDLLQEANIFAGSVPEDKLDVSIP